MHVVDDVVAGLEVVVVVGPATRAARATVHPAAAGEVGFGHEREVRARQHDAAFEWRGDEPDRAGRGLTRVRVDAFAREHVVQAQRRARAFRREHDAVALARERAQSTGERVGVARDGVERGRGDARRVGAFRCREHRHRARTGVREQAVEVEGESRQLELGGRAPRGRERARERGLLVEQVLRAVAHPLRLHQQHQRGVGQEVGEQVLTLGQPRQPRLHAVEHLALGDALPLLAAPRLRAHERGGALAHLGGREQLARRDRSTRRRRRAWIAGRRPRTPTGDRPRRPTGRCARGGRRWTGRRRRSSPAPRARRATPPGTRAGTPRRRAAPRARRGRPGRPCARRRARAPRREGRAVAPARAPAPPAPTGRGPERSRHSTRRRRPIVASDGDTRSNGSVSHAGNSSTSSGPRNCPRSCTSRSASAPVGTASTSGRRVVTSANAATKSARAASGTATTGSRLTTARTAGSSARRPASAASGGDSGIFGHSVPVNLS